MDMPMVAWMLAACRSRVIEGNPSAYAPDEEAVDMPSDMQSAMELRKDRPVIREKKDAVSVMAHFLVYVKFAGSR